MKNKDKKIKELEEQIEVERFAIILIVTLAFISIGFMIYYADKANDLKQELQSCQEKITTWTLEYKCIKSESTIISVQRNFSNYENYNDNKIYFDRQENCQVIK